MLRLPEQSQGQPDLGCSDWSCAVQKSGEESRVALESPRCSALSVEYTLDFVVSVQQIKKNLSFFFLLL